MTAFRIDVREVEDMAARLDRLSGEVLQDAATAAVNEVATRTDRVSVDRIAGRVNLTRDYIKGKLRLDLAERGSNPRAEIVASENLTPLGNYGPVQLRVAGTPARSGPTAGRRPSGVAIEISKGKPVQETQWFTMRLRNTASKIGVFVRTSATGGKPKHIYGPSPYSLLRQQGQYHADEILDDLESTMLRRANEAIGEALS